MKSVIFYFSGTGNTALIAEEFCKKLSCSMYEIKYKGGIDVDLNTVDLIGIGYPVHAFNPPQMVMKWVKSLPKNIHKNVFIFKTSGEALHLNHPSSRRMIRLLKKKGYRVINEFHYVMPYNIVYRHSKPMAKQLYSVAIKLNDLDVLELKKGLVNPPHYGMLEGWYTPLFRILTPFAKCHGTRFKIDQSKCLHCRLCVDTCPTHNITEVNNTYKFHHRCILCMRCSFNCPGDAIKIGIFNRFWKVNPSYRLKELLKDEKVVIPTEDYGCRLLKRSYHRYFVNAGKRLNKARCECVDCIPEESNDEVIKKVPY